MFQKLEDTFRQASQRWQQMDRKTRMKHLGIIAFLGILGGGIPGNFTYVGSNSPSMPNRLFFLDNNPSVIKKGDIVQFRHEPDTLAVKKVACMAPSALTVKPDTREFYCDGKLIGQAKFHSVRGERLPFFQWDGPVPEGQIFVMGDHRDSFDSRYFGFVPTGKVVAKGYPII